MVGVRDVKNKHLQRLLARVTVMGPVGQSVSFLAALALHRKADSVSVLGALAGIGVGVLFQTVRMLRHRGGRHTSLKSAQRDQAFERVASFGDIVIYLSMVVGVALVTIGGRPFASSMAVSTAVGTLIALPLFGHDWLSRRHRRLRPGTLVGGWRVLSFLASGGYGDVYIALRGTTRAALKVIQPRWANDAVVIGRFEREIQAGEQLRSVDSPRVIRHLDGAITDDAAYLVTEYKRGTDLKTFVAEGNFDDDALIAFASELAEALAAVHTQGIVHRDLGPGNVLVTRDGVRLIDFGVAWLPDGAGLTTQHQPGTRSFGAPEQLEGASKHPEISPAITSATDVFSWASTVFFAATGKPPFGQYESRDADAFTTRVCTEPVALDASIPPQLHEVLRRAFSKRSSDRPSAAQLVDTLRQLPHRPVVWSRVLASTGGRTTRALPYVATAAASVLFFVGLAYAAPRVEQRTAEVARSQTPTSPPNASSSTTEGARSPTSTSVEVPATSAATTVATSAPTTEATSTLASTTVPSPATGGQVVRPVTDTSAPTNEVVVLDTSSQPPVTVSATSASTAATTTTAATEAPCRPDTPAVGGQTIEDATVIQHLTTGGCTDHITLTWKPDAPSLPIPRALAADGSYRMDHLINCVPYDFLARAISPTGLASEPVTFRGVPHRPGVDCSVVLQGYGLGPFPFGTSFDAVTAWLTGQYGAPTAIPADPYCAVDAGYAWGALRVFPSRGGGDFHHWEYGVTNNDMPGVTDAFALHMNDPVVYIGTPMRDAGQIPGFQYFDTPYPGSSGQSGSVNGVFVQFTSGYMRGMTADGGHVCIA